MNLTLVNYAVFQDQVLRNSNLYQTFITSSLWFLYLQSDPIEFVENICENMHIFEKEDLLTGDQLLIEYNAEVSGAHMCLKKKK